MGYSKRNFFSYYSASSNEGESSCAHEGCDEKGLHKAFRNPRFLHNPILLCEDHIKIHNQSLDYFHDMSAEDIEQEIRADSVWRRPTWPLGTQQQKFSYYFEDPVDIQRRIQKMSTYQQDTEKELERALPSHVYEAIKMLDLNMPVSFIELKKAYKTKVKLYHPDVNKGAKEAAEKFKQVSEAYKILKSYLF